MDGWHRPLPGPPKWVRLSLLSVSRSPQLCGLSVLLSHKVVQSNLVQFKLNPQAHCWPWGSSLSTLLGRRKENSIVALGHLHNRFWGERQYRHASASILEAQSFPNTYFSSCFVVFLWNKILWVLIDSSQGGNNCIWLVFLPFILKLLEDIHMFWLLRVTACRVLPLGGAGIGLTLRGEVAGSVRQASWISAQVSREYKQTDLEPSSWVGILAPLLTNGGTQEDCLTCKMQVLLLPTSRMVVKIKLATCTKVPHTEQTFT